MRWRWELLKGKLRHIHIFFFQVYLHIHWFMLGGAKQRCLEALHKQELGRGFSGEDVEAKQEIIRLAVA